MATRSLQPSRNAEPPTEQGSSARYCSEATRFEEATVEGWDVDERYHEFARFVTSFIPVRVVIEEPSISVKASDSQHEDSRLTDEEIIPQVR